MSEPRILFAVDNGSSKLLVTADECTGRAVLAVEDATGASLARIDGTQAVALALSMLSVADPERIARMAERMPEEISIQLGAALLAPTAAASILRAHPVGEGAN